ncbi:MAG: hypothetical protein AB1646_25610 [Thermodesulfobacteriota bacterium]
MKLIHVLGAMSLVVATMCAPTSGYAQAYPYAVPTRPVPQAGPPVHGRPYFYYFVPRPEVARKWDRQQRWLQYDHQFRSPYNPETSLEYMLRTF